MPTCFAEPVPFASSSEPTAEKDHRFLKIKISKLQQRGEASGGLTLANHLHIFVLRRTLALLRPVQIVALADKEISHLLNEDIQARRVFQPPHLVHGLNEQKVGGVDRRSLSEDGVRRGLATTERR